MEKTFTFENQDHTIGNIIRHQLLRNPNITFAAYRTPHPLDRSVEIHVSSKDPDTDFDMAVEDLIGQVDELQKAFEKALS